MFKSEFLYPLILLLLLALSSCSSTYSTTSYRATVNTEKIKEPRLPLKEIDDYEYFYFRYFGNQQVVDIYETPFGNFEGQILNYTYQKNYDSRDLLDKKYKITRYQSSDTIASSIANKLGIYLKFVEYGKFVPDSLIVKYNRDWLHCRYSSYEVVKARQRYKIIYPCLTNQENFDELIVPKHLDAQLNKLIPFEESFALFVNDLPKGQSYQRGHTIAYKLTDKQMEYRRMHAPRLNYIRETRDSITSLISEHVNDLYQQVDIVKRKRLEEICFCEFKVIFNRDGSLKELNDYTKRSERDRDYRSCRKEVLRLLDKIKPKFQFIFEPVKSLFIWADSIEVEDKFVY